MSILHFYFIMKYSAINVGLGGEMHERLSDLQSFLYIYLVMTHEDFLI